MDKQEASRVVNKQHGTALLNPNNGGNVSWANINTAKDVWWADISVNKFINDFYLILNNEIKKEFYLISIVKGEVNSPYKLFRRLRENYISIELSSRESNKFIDVKSGGTGVDFKKYKIELFNYGDGQTGNSVKAKNKINESVIKENIDHTQLNTMPVQSLENEMAYLFEQLNNLQHKIQCKLEQHCDSKNLKGNEVVGWLGEIFGKLLFKGRMVDDSFEHDIETSDGKRISVKTRKGWKSGWTQSSAIPKINGDNCPTHLLFVHLNDNYSVHGMWLFEWNLLKRSERFRRHIVRGNLRSYIFHLNEITDKNCKVYP